MFAVASVKVRVATTLAQARRALSECAADVIISEENLPEISGTDFLHDAAETCPQSYCVLVTGEPIMVKAIRDVSSGHIHVFVPSPWTVENIRHVLELAEMQFRSGRKRH